MLPKYNKDSISIFFNILRTRFPAVASILNRKAQQLPPLLLHFISESKSSISTFIHIATPMFHHGESDSPHYLTQSPLLHVANLVHSHDFRLNIQGAGHDYHPI